MSPRRVNVQTDAVPPQCICKNTLKLKSSCTEKGAEPAQALHFFMFSFWKEARDEVCLSSVAIWAVPHTEIRRKQLSLISTLFFNKNWLRSIKSFSVINFVFAAATLTWNERLTGVSNHFYQFICLSTAISEWHTLCRTFISTQNALIKSNGSSNSHLACFCQNTKMEASFLRTMVLRNLLLSVCAESCEMLKCDVELSELHA